MAEIDTRDCLLNGIWIQEKYEGAVDSAKGSMTLTKNYLLRKKGDKRQNKTQEMHQTEAYAALQSFIVQFQYSVIYQTNEGDILLWASKIRAETNKQNYPVYSGTVTWDFDPRKPNYITQPVIWSHQMGGGTRNFAFPAQPQRYYTAPNMPIVPHVGVNYNASNRVYEGVDCFAPEWRIRAKQQLLESLVTPEYIQTLQWMSKTVNSEPFQGFLPGSVLYLGADMEQSLDKNNNILWDLTHQFVVEPNMENFDVGGIQVPLKKGHEYLWFTSIFTEEGPQVTQVNVAPMYNETDLNLLGLG